jgi:hypothetical protein
MTTPYSLGKLIDWKPAIASMNCELSYNNGSIPSLLARETNWLETGWDRVWAIANFISLLARETNWLETEKQKQLEKQLAPYSLGKLIDWKL